MTNYNDGKWHGWNGGECPLHPETTVDVVVSSGDRRTVKSKSWHNYHQIIAFRVIEEWKKPREFWVRRITDFNLNGKVIGHTYQECKECQADFKVREVIE